MAKSGYEMASEKLTNDYLWERWRYSLKDNPYPRKHPKHVEWHNEFYEGCKKVGRRYK